MLKLGKYEVNPSFSPGGLSYLTFGLVFFISVVWRLGDLLPGLSASEAAQKDQIKNLHNLGTNLIDAPFRIVQHLFITLHPDKIVSMRLASVLFALVASLCFYHLVCGWFGKSIGLLGALIFISLPLFAVSGRQASPEIMLFSPLVLMYLYTKVLKSNNVGLWAVLAFAVGLLLYTPGMVWWLIGAAALCYRKLSARLNEAASRVSVIVLGILCISIAPLVIVAIKHPIFLKQLLLVPANLAGPAHLASRFIHMLGALFVKMPYTSPLVVGRTPVLNILLIALAIFGVYAMRTVARDKAIALGAAVIYGLIAATVTDDFIYLAYCVPALLIFVTAGLRYLYIEWRTIFPRNPVPKTFALVLITAVTLSQLYYSWHYTLSAWPHSTVAKSAYVIK
jgi:4-amino-4-deoxy-L-arabinose transferase-like glycosyltransferase